MRRLPLPGLVGAFALLNAAWMPTAGWQPVPAPVMAEINTFFTSMEQDRLNYDAASVLTHYTPDITFRLETPDGTLRRMLDEAAIRQSITLPIEYDQKHHVDSNAAHPHRRQDYQYQPGPDDQHFAIRFKEYFIRPDGSAEPQPFADVACVFVRGPMGLRISLEIIRVMHPEFQGVHAPALRSGQRIISVEPATTTSTIPPTDK